MSVEEHNREPRPSIGQVVTWSEHRKWGGTQSNPAIYLGNRGRLSGRIRVGNEERTVRVASLKWAQDSSADSGDNNRNKKCPASETKS